MGFPAGAGIGIVSPYLPENAVGRKKAGRTGMPLSILSNLGFLKVPVPSMPFQI